MVDVIVSMLRVDDNVLEHQQNNDNQFQSLSIHYHYMYFENEYDRLLLEHDQQFYKNIK
jgi:hypothetical protein